MIVKSKLRWWYERIRLLPMYTFPSALCAQCRSICASELRTLCCPQAQKISRRFGMLWTFYEGGKRRSSCLSKIRFSYRNRKVVVRRWAKAASEAMPHRQKHGVDNPKRRGCAPPFWSLGGAGGEVETPPAFLLGDSKGELLFWKRTSPFAPSSAIGAATPPAQSTGYFSSIFLKKWKKTKNDWPLIAITELRSRVSHDEYLDLSYSVFFPSFLQWSGAEYRLLRFPLLLSQTPRLRRFYLNDGTHQRVLRDGYDRNHLGSPLWRSLVHWSHPFCA